jgi:cob(I)alamin adenosyltransferase
MKVYTRTGDAGTTGLFAGPRVSKHDSRISAYGTVDELNAVVGLARAELGREQRDDSGDRLDDLLLRIQHDLFVLGADLATPTEASAATARVEDEHIERLEREIDRMDEDLPELKNFILPGGSPAAARLHVARTVCRRAERLAVTAAEAHELNEQAVVYLNRLSDLLFMAARWINHARGVSDTVWRSRD